MNSFISWIGGKKALRKLLYKLFPKNHTRYIEVFGGGGWVLFGKRQRKNCMEVYNDFNSNLVNLFLCVKERPLAFLKELGFLPLCSRDEFGVLRKFIEQEEFTDAYMAEELKLAEKFIPPPSVDEMKLLYEKKSQLYEVKRAAAFFKLIKYSYGSSTTSFGGQPCDIRKCFKIIWEASERLKDVVIENKDFEDFIKQYDREGAFIYCDPPYFGTEGHYAVGFPKENHVRLRDTLSACKGLWMVSYNDCEYIRELYKDFHIRTVVRINNLAQRYEGGAEYRELVITNFDPKKMIIKDFSFQMNLFSDLEDEDEQFEYYLKED